MTDGLGLRDVRLVVVGDAFAAGVLTPFFDTPLRRRAEGHPNLAPYCERMMRRYYPQFIKKAA